MTGERPLFLCAVKGGVRTRKDQVRFGEDLRGSLPALLVRDTQSGKLPEEWDGIELR